MHRAMVVGNRAAEETQTAARFFRLAADERLSVTGQHVADMVGILVQLGFLCPSAAMVSSKFMLFSITAVDNDTCLT